MRRVVVLKRLLSVAKGRGDGWWCGLISVTRNDGESVDVHEDLSIMSR